MTDKKVITEEMVAEAKDYMPLMEKDAWVQEVCDSCLDKIQLAAEDDGMQTAMPSFFKDNTQRKSRYLMGKFLSFYFGIKFEPVSNEQGIMAADDYDRWAGSHVFNQLERMKSGKGEVRDKVFDILSDYRDLEKRLNTEVYNLLQLQNDPATRLLAHFSVMNTPESVQKQMEELKKVTEEIEKFKAEKEAVKEDA